MKRKGIVPFGLNCKLSARAGNYIASAFIAMMEKIVADYPMSTNIA